MCRHPIAWVSNFWANNSGLTAGREKHGSEPPLQLFAMQALCSFYSPSDEQRWRKWSNGKGKCITIPSDQCTNRVNLLNNPSSDAALGTSGNVIPFVIQLYLGLSQMVPPILCFLLHHSSVVLEAHHHKWTNENTSAQLEASGWDEDLSRLRYPCNRLNELRDSTGSDLSYTVVNLQWKPGEATPEWDARTWSSASMQLCWYLMASKRSQQRQNLQENESRGVWMVTKRPGRSKKVIFFQLYLKWSSFPRCVAPGVPAGMGRLTWWLSLVAQQLFPADGLGKHLPLQPQLVGVVEVLGELQPLPQHALQAVVHRCKLWILRFVISAAVEGFDAGSQCAFFSLEVPRPRINI